MTDIAVKSSLPFKLFYFHSKGLDHWLTGILCLLSYIFFWFKYRDVLFNDSIHSEYSVIQREENRKAERKECDFC
jgi:hypothetical protein